MTYELTSEGMNNSQQVKLCQDSLIIEFSDKDSMEYRHEILSVLKILLKENKIPAKVWYNYIAYGKPTVWLSHTQV